MATESPRSAAPQLNVVVRPLREDDLPLADGIMRLAFGTFLGLKEPRSFMGDADCVRTRWRADPGGAFAAEVAGELVGSNLATVWGSVGFFGPLTVRPELWDKGVAKRLLEPVMACLDARGVKHAGLFTFAHSPKHVRLYQKFGFWPRFLTALMSKVVSPPAGARQSTTFSEVPDAEREATLRACRTLTDSVYAGLDVTPEIRAVADQRLGDTVFIWDAGKLTGLIVCHCGPGSEAGSGNCYAKFGVVRSGAGAAQRFDRLLDAGEELAAERQLKRIVAGVNMARHDAYGRLIARGYRTDFQGVAMSRPDEPGYNRPDVFLVDDWR